MPFRSILSLVVSFSFFAGLVTLGAQEPTKKEPLAEVEKAVTIAGQRVDYKVTTSRLPVTDLTGKAKANIYFMAYTRKTEKLSAPRPLMFCFNGGPGSASLWVHLGLFGPRRIQIDEEGKSLPLPPQIIDNEWSVLDLTDLVFIDPVSTGFSRSDDPKEAKLFHGLEEDTHSVGEFIRSYVAKYDRKDSPTYVAGESYGTTRAASLSNYLQNKGGVNLAGILLISTVLDWETIRFGVGNDMPYPFFLPTYTAAAFHHKKLDRGNNLSTVLEESEQFANGPYVAALRKGNLLTDEERRATAKTMAKFTGLSEDYLTRQNLRVDATKFRTELLRDSGEVIGRYDSRVKAKTKQAAAKEKAKDAKDNPKQQAKKGGGGAADPSNALLSGPFGDSIRNYLLNELKFEIDVKYNTSGQVQPWSYGDAGKNRYPNIAPRLRAAMEKNRNLRVFVACGYSDLATPYSAVKYTFAHFGPPPLMDRVTIAYYESGHMMYTHQPSLRKIGADLRKFLSHEGSIRAVNN
jgi:carboxypeptidase C (cathepsin A)